MSTELSFNVDLDEHGVIDGRELARHMIWSAYQLLVPYVQGCPGCTDKLFTIIANKVIGELHENSPDGLPGTLYCKFEGEERRAAETAHLEAATERTRELLSEDNPEHDQADHMH